MNLDCDFIDEAKITVRSGNGGKGCVGFRRERFIPKGGPSGGNGGDGGDIYFRATTALTTLSRYRYKRQFSAADGKGGMGSLKDGRRGDDLILDVPVGTIVFDHDSGEMLCDITGLDTSILFLHGGRGGKGNAHFKSSTNQTPKYAQTGIEGEERVLRLELKLLSDVGLIGLPNAGKSSLISVVTNAKPKIAGYPFTTLTPHLGVVRLEDYREYVLSDIPGLIRDAHLGAGLGVKFLRHVERARLLAMLIDISELSDENPFEPYDILKNELEAFHPGLSKRIAMILLTKIDLVEVERKEHIFSLYRERFNHLGCISTATMSGVREVIYRLGSMLFEEKEKQTIDPTFDILR